MSNNRSCGVPILGANNTNSNWKRLVKSWITLFTADFCIAYSMELISLKKNCSMIPTNIQRTATSKADGLISCEDILKRLFQLI